MTRIEDCADNRSFPIDGGRLHPLNRVVRLVFFRENCGFCPRDVSAPAHDRPRPRLADFPVKKHPPPHRSKFSKSDSATHRRQGWEIALSGDLTEKQSDLVEALLELEPGSRGTLYFDSPGGNVYAGISLASLIRLRHLKATAVVLGECSSAAIVPFAACEERYVLPFSTLFFHPVRSSSEEDIQLEEAAEWARHFAIIEEEMDQLLARFFGRPYEQVRAWSRPGRFFTGREVAELGLARELDLAGGDLQEQIARIRRQANTPNPAQPPGA